MRRLVGWLFLVLASISSPAHASLLADISLGSLPFGPFLPDEPVVIAGSATNISNQSITLCEGICLGDATTYSLGALASSPGSYVFFFGNGGDASAGFLDGQLNGVLLPGQTRTFTFGEYVPISVSTPPGFYGFFDQLQIFATTPDRPMLGSS